MTLKLPYLPRRRHGPSSLPVVDLLRRGQQAVLRRSAPSGSQLTGGADAVLKPAHQSQSEGAWYKASLCTEHNLQTAPIIRSLLWKIKLHPLLLNSIPKQAADDITFRLNIMELVLQALI